MFAAAWRRGWVRCMGSSTATSTARVAARDDVVSVKALAVSCIAGKDYWARPVLQPMEVSVDLHTSFRRAAATDDLRYSLNYATISRNVADYFKANEAHNFRSMERIADGIFGVIFDRDNGSNGEAATVVLRNRRSEIRCDSVALEQFRTVGSGDAAPAAPAARTLKIERLRLLTVIGIFNFERLQKQAVHLDIAVQYRAATLDYSTLIAKITDYVEGAQFKTVEALVENVAYIVLSHSEAIDTADVGVVKPNAILFSDGVGVSITRSRHDLPGMQLVSFDVPEAADDGATALPNLSAETSLDGSRSCHTTYIAFGSNDGDPFANIEAALRKLPEHGVHVQSTSSLYESRPMYYLDQPNFYNGVVKCTTALEPHALLQALKAVEYQDLQRVKDFDNGPRSIDLDIVLYDNLILDTPDLKIPHVAAIDRTFVMAPLCELVSPDEVHPVTAETLHAHLDQLLRSESDPAVQASNRLTNVVPLPRNRRLAFDMVDGTSRTLVMGILNVTPDSFSDGGANFALQDALKTAREMVAAGVDIIDVGGCSTRPGSPQVSEQQELQRVIPVVESIRQQVSDDVVISIDTYRSAVAEQAIQAGADIVNDISAGQFDERIFDVVAKYQVPYVVNHTRGSIEDMNALTDYTDTDSEIAVYSVARNASYHSEKDQTVTTVVGKELFQQISRALAKGVRKWQLILDPGLGFAKSTDQNLSLIRSTPLLKNSAFQHGDTYFSMQRLPALLAPSRKRFIGNVTHVPQPQDRHAANVATLTSCIGYGADIIRVHDFRDSQQLVSMADALYKDLITPN